MLSATTSFIVDLFVLFACAVIAGEIAVHLGQVALVGQLLVGVVLGPTLLGPYLGLTSLTPQLGSLQFLATVFILFISGLEVVPEDIIRGGARPVVLGVAMFFGTFVVTSLVAIVFEPGLGTTTDFYIGLVLSITALPVMGIMLSEFGLLRTKMGNLLMGAALINEISAVTVFAVMQQITSSGGNGYLSAVKALGLVTLFIGIMVTIHLSLRKIREARLWKPLTETFARTWRSKQGGFAILMVMLVGSTLLSQFLGLTYVVGAFYAGMLVTRESAGVKAHREISSIFDAMSWGFFVPLFFAFVGVEMNLQNLLHVPVLEAFFALLAAGIAAKILIGAGIARVFDWRAADAKAIGYLVCSRGAVELAMATILLQAGFIDTTIFTIVAAVGLVATIIAPIGALQSWLADEKSREDMFRRAPSLRTKSPSVRQLRPPVDWATASNASSPPPVQRASPPSASVGAVDSTRLPLPPTRKRPPNR